MHIANSDRPVQFYSLDVVISVGYRVKSKHGTEFRQWVNSVLKQYIIEEYAINEKRLKALERTVDIQTKMLADALDVEESDILQAVNQYTDALLLLDQYDHQVVPKPDGSEPIYRITYEECCQMVDAMRDSFQIVNINQYNTQTKMKIMGQTDKQSVQQHPFPHFMIRIPRC